MDSEKPHLGEKKQPWEPWLSACSLQFALWYDRLSVSCWPTTAILCRLLRNCTKRIKQEFLDTNSVQSKTFAYYLWQI